ncbi:phage tail tape measure protein, partial [Hoyosella altamirensis]|uniref:phage tail tape measure protein n=1 Tax=Hoyosella altamirensis TaxID=616997 RepID=UPI0007DB23A1
MATATDSAVWLPVLPSFKDFGGMLKKEGTKAGRSAGEDVAKAMADGIEKSKAAVEKASEAAQKAHDRVADSAGKVRVAEERLAEVRANPKASAAQIAQAEERLASERRKSEQASAAAERADDKLAGAKDKLSKAQKDATDSASDQSKATEDLLKSQEKAAQASSDLEKAQDALKLGFLAASAAAAGVAVALVQIGSDFDEAYRTIRVGTGATGEALEGLQESAKNVGATVPNAFGDVAATLADLNTRLGFTGEPLEHLTRQFLELENLTGTAVNIESVSGALNAFGVEADDAGGVMDSLFQISQATGVEVNDLAEAARKGGPALREFGFDLGESAALAGMLDKAGLDVNRTFRGMSTAMSQLAKDGKDPQEAFWETTDAIQGLIEAGDRGAAIDMASGIFGTQGAQQFIEAVENGALSIDDFQSAIGASDDTILGLADETRTLSEEWQIFKNQALMTIEPVATRVFNALRDGGKWLMENVVPPVQSLAEWFGRNKDLLIALGAALGTSLAIYATYQGVVMAITVATRAWNAIQMLLNGTLRANPIGLIVTAIGLLVGALVLAYQRSDTFREIVQNAWQKIQEAVSFAWGLIQPVFAAISDWITGTLVPAVMGFWQNAVKPAFEAIGQIIKWVWDNVIVNIFEAYRYWILDVIVPAVMWLWQNVIKPGFEGIGTIISNVWNNVVSPVFEALKTGVDLVGKAFDKAVTWIGEVWEKIRAIAARPVKFVIESVYNNGIRAAWNKVAGWLGLKELDEYKPSWLGQYHTGGVLPGYSPGHDDLHFVSTDGRAAIELGGGEGIARPEVVRVLGTDYFLGMNEAAEKGGVRGVERYLGGYASGGIIGPNARITSGVQRGMWDQVRTRFPMMTLTSATRSSNDHHGSALAIDVSNGGSAGTPEMAALARWIYGSYGPQSLELIHWPLQGFQNIKNGAPLNYGEPTNSQHRDHVHWAMANAPGEPGQEPEPGFWDQVGGAWSSFWRGRVASAFDAIMDPIGERIPDFGDSLMGSVPKSAFDKFRGDVRDWLLGKADEKDGSAADGIVTDSVSGPVKDVVKEAFAPRGWDTGAQWDAVDYIVTRESGWNPNAQNPTSSAYGLFQFLDSTWATVGGQKTSDPYQQGVYGERYIGQRYGDPVSARRFWEANHWYDQGGLAKHIGMLLK